MGPGMEEVGFLENWGLGGDTPPPGFPTWRRGLGAEILGSGSPCARLFLDRKGQRRQMAWANSSLPLPSSATPLPLAQEPYLQSQCDCCSYRLDPENPVRILNLRCPGGRTELVVLPVIHSCQCSACQGGCGRGSRRGGVMVGGAGRGRGRG